MLQIEYKITSIQHFSTGDGDGIRTTVFFYGCNLHCPWCHNPETWHDSKVKDLVSYSITIEDLVQEILKDKDFYLESGGGVTLSGGEVMLKANELVPLLRALKEENIQVLIDTAGDVPYDNFKITNEYVSGYLFDIKSADKEKYKDVIGADFDNISNNLKNLIRDNMNVRIRIPQIPDFNTDDMEIKKITMYLKSLNISEVDLLPFHRMGAGKYEKLGIEYIYSDMPGMTKDEAKEIYIKYKDNFKVKVE